MRFCYLLYIHSALRGGHNNRAPFRTVEQDAHIIFLRLAFSGIINILGDQYLIYLLSVRSGLVCNKCTAKNSLHFVWYLRYIFGQYDPVGTSFSYFSLSSTTGMDL